MHNFEAYSVISASPREALDVSSLDEFIARHAGNIRTIDQEALERAARNLVQPIARSVRPPIRPGVRRPLPARPPALAFWTATIM
jgi:hypothetical protein